jgi:hypothetical protein
MRVYMARSMAKKEKKVILLDAFENPFKIKGKPVMLFHNDFEDITEVGIRGGVFLVGMQIENGARKVVFKDHIFADKKLQYNFDEVIAELLRTIKNSKYLKREYYITVYSHHEATKIEQVFDIVKDKPEKFTPAERRSLYYSEITNAKGKIVGRLIRNKAFFKSFPDLDPDDVFSYLDHIVDLLPFYRKFIMTNQYTNSLKYLAPVFSDDDLTLNYPKGHNGLEVQAWVNNFWTTNNPKGKSDAIFYVQEDVNGNRLLTRPIEDLADKAPDKRFQWSKKALGVLALVEQAVSKSRRIVDLKEKHEMLSKILGKDLLKISNEERAELKKLLDLSGYIAARKAVRDDKAFNEAEEKSILQQIKVEFEDSRAKGLIAFFEKINPKLLDERANGAQSALAELLTLPLNALWPTHIDLIVLLDVLSEASPEISTKGDPLDRLDRPRDWDVFFKSLSTKLKADEYKIGKFQLEEIEKDKIDEILEGFYYARIFGIISK